MESHLPNGSPEHIPALFDVGCLKLPVTGNREGRHGLGYAIQVDITRLNTAAGTFSVFPKPVRRSRILVVAPTGFADFLVPGLGYSGIGQGMVVAFDGEDFGGHGEGAAHRRISILLPAIVAAQANLRIGQSVGLALEGRHAVLFLRGGGGTRGVFSKLDLVVDASIAAHQGSGHVDDALIVRAVNGQARPLGHQQVRPLRNGKGAIQGDIAVDLEIASVIIDLDVLDAICGNAGGFGIVVCDILGKLDEGAALADDTSAIKSTAADGIIGSRGGDIAAGDGDIAAILTVAAANGRYMGVRGFIFGRNRTAGNQDFAGFSEFTAAANGRAVCCRRAGQGCGDFAAGDGDVNRLRVETVADGRTVGFAIPDFGCHIAAADGDGAAIALIAAADGRALGGGSGFGINRGSNICAAADGDGSGIAMGAAADARSGAPAGKGDIHGAAQEIQGAAGAAVSVVITAADASGRNAACVVARHNGHLNRYGTAPDGEAGVAGAVAAADARTIDTKAAFDVHGNAAPIDFDRSGIAAFAAADARAIDAAIVGGFKNNYRHIRAIEEDAAAGFAAIAADDGIIDNISRLYYRGFYPAKAILLRCGREIELQGGVGAHVDALFGDELAAGGIHHQIHAALDLQPLIQGLALAEQEPCGGAAVVGEGDGLIPGGEELAVGGLGSAILVIIVDYGALLQHGGLGGHGEGVLFKPGIVQEPCAARRILDGDLGILLVIGAVLPVHRQSCLRILRGGDGGALGIGQPVVGIAIFPGKGAVHIDRTGQAGFGFVIERRALGDVQPNSLGNRLIQGLISVNDKDFMINPRDITLIQKVKYAGPGCLL